MIKLDALAEAKRVPRRHRLHLSDQHPGGTDGESHEARRFLDQFDMQGINAAITQQAVTIRQTRRIRLPDTTIQATTQVAQALLRTRNTQEFPEDDPRVRMPYRL